MKQLALSALSVRPSDPAHYVEVSNVLMQEVIKSPRRSNCLRKLSVDKPIVSGKLWKIISVKVKVKRVAQKPRLRSRSLKFNVATKKLWRYRVEKILCREHTCCYQMWRCSLLVKQTRRGTMGQSHFVIRVTHETIAFY